MEIRETPESCLRQFLELANRYCPKLEQLYLRHSGFSTKQPIRLGTKPWKLFSKVAFVNEDQSNLKMTVRPPDPFADGLWRDLEITVHDGTYLESVKQVAIEYEARTKKKVAVLKEF